MNTPDTKRPALVMLDMDRLSETAQLGHILEATGSIAHDVDYAAEIDNDLCRARLRETEAFEAGYQCAQMEATNKRTDEVSRTLANVRTLIERQNDFLSAQAVLDHIARALDGQMVELD
jgi:hypothetical protein